MNAALYYWQATRRGSWRRAVVVALVCGLLGTVALGALAGARRTDTAYGRYLASINSSDVFVNIPGPDLAAIRQVERLPGVVSGRAWLGLAGTPIVHGRVDDSFTASGLAGSLHNQIGVMDQFIKRKDRHRMCQARCNFFRAGEVLIRDASQNSCGPAAVQLGREIPPDRSHSNNADFQRTRWRTHASSSIRSIARRALIAISWGTCTRGESVSSERMMRSSVIVFMKAQIASGLTG